jgi:transcriptional regulator with XRE-family HTH domain
MKEYLEDFKGIPYKEQTPQQRWALICEKVRKKNGWSSRAPLARHFGVVTSTVTFWEQAKSFPKNEYVYKMAKLTNVTPDELINHLNNSKEIKLAREMKPKVKIVESAKNLTEEELREVINDLVQLIINRKSGGQSGQLSLGI